MPAFSMRIVGRMVEHSVSYTEAEVQMLKLSIPRRTGLLALFAFAAVICLAAPLSAHHGWGGYHTEEFELSGTLETAVSTAGPHATTKMRTADGKVWDIVLAPGGRTVSAGLKEDVIPVGSKVTVHGIVTGIPTSSRSRRSD